MSIAAFFSALRAAACSNLLAVPPGPQARGALTSAGRAWVITHHVANVLPPLASFIGYPRPIEVLIINPNRNSGFKCTNITVQAQEAALIDIGNAGIRARRFISYGDSRATSK